MFFLIIICIAELLLITVLIRKLYRIYQELCHLAYAKDRDVRLILLCEKYIRNRNAGKEYMEWNGIETVAIYGIGKTYVLFIQDILEDIHVKYCIDKYSQKRLIDGKSVIRPKDIALMEPVDAILIMPIGFDEEIRQELKEEFKVGIQILDIESVINFESQKISCQ